VRVRSLSLCARVRAPMRTPVIPVHSVFPTLTRCFTRSRAVMTPESMVPFYCGGFDTCLGLRVSAPAVDGITDQTRTDTGTNAWHHCASAATKVNTVLIVVDPVLA
jgi:hypothetical protein